MRRELRRHGQILEPGDGAGVAVGELEGIVLDESDAEFTGDWIESTSIGPFLGQGYHHDGNREKGDKSAELKVKSPRSGLFEVRVAYTAHQNRATEVPIEVATDRGSDTVHIDQTQPGPIRGMLKSIATYRFQEGETVTIRISNAGTEGHVIIDGIQLVRERESSSLEDDNQSALAHGSSLTRITSGPVVSDGGRSTAASWVDFNQDGLTDLYVVNAGNNFLYRNTGEGTFAKVTGINIVEDGGDSPLKLHQCATSDLSCLPPADALT